MPRGGKRPGAGRKPKTAFERAVTGNPGHRGRVLSHPSAGTVPVLPPIEEFDAPDILTTDERLVWLRQAPFAFANRTLNKTSALAFERYCQLVVRERYEAKSSGCDGANHARMLRTLNTLELQFMLTPCGKPIYEPAPAEAPANPLERFLKRG